MFDVKAIRDDRAVFDRGWTSRGLDGPAETQRILDADAKLRAAKAAFETAQARRNEASKLIGAAKKAGDDARRRRADGRGRGAEGQARRPAGGREGRGRRSARAALRPPQPPRRRRAEGADEHGNVEQVDRRFGDPAALPAGRLSAPKDHVELGERLGMMDFEAAARMSGARFVVLKRDLARLERALGQFMLDLQTREHGYEEVSPPLLVRRSSAVEGTGQLPKFWTDQISLKSGDLIWESSIQIAEATSAR